MFKYLNNLNVISYCDAAVLGQFGTQDPATPIMEGMISFHNYLMYFMICIGILVCWLLVQVVVRYNHLANPRSEKFAHYSALEIGWTIFPAIVLVIIAIPSFSLLYSLDELVSPSLTLKIIGHQWYWSYEYSADSINSLDNPISFDSYMVATSELKSGALRLLEVDNRVCLPVKTHCRLLITAADVLHSWAVPSFGIKVDACPGRLSEAFLYVKRQGVYYGQCSEICGVNHGFMPIVVEVHSVPDFLFWQSNNV